ELNGSTARTCTSTTDLLLMRAQGTRAREKPQPQLHRKLLVLTVCSSPDREFFQSVYCIRERRF
ncbi:MAG TPA: hypothetical protein VF614_15905, partial [Chthoniobacteraceae bacterium]